jgi:chromosome segregation ATPase
MLLVILLLLLFIFLRDRTLRLRLSAFLAGARRRSVLLQLKYKLRKERRNKESALRRLGEKAWDADLRFEGAQPIRAALEEAVKKRDNAQMEWKNAIAEAEVLHKRLAEENAVFEQKIQEQRTGKKPLEELLKKKREEERALKKLPPGQDVERQIDELRREMGATFGRVQELARQIKETEAEKKGRLHAIAREIHHSKKRKEKFQERIKEIEAEQERFYLSLGQILDQNRVESPELRDLYAEVDLVNGRLETLQHRIAILSGG